MTVSTAPAVSIGKATEFDLDPAVGSWAAKCNRHDLVVQFKNRDMARAAAKNSSEFCESCRDVDQDIDPESLEMERFENSADAIEKFEGVSVQLEPDSLVFTDPGAFLDGTNNNDDPDTGGEMALTSVYQLLSEQTSDEPMPDVVGTFHAGNSDVVHHAVKTSGLYFTAVCGPTMLMGESDDSNAPGMCTYCLAGVTAPTDKPKQTRVKAARVKAEKSNVVRIRKIETPVEPVPEPKYSTETSDLYDAAHNLLDRLQAQASAPDARRGLEILEPVLTMLKGMLPRRAVGRPTGARSGLVKQSATVNPSDQLAKAQAFADRGDKRAQDILEHVKVYIPGEDCGYCLARGRSTRHGYATAFCSIGRELRAMEQRAANG